MFDVLLTGAESRQTIVVIRSLGKHGIRMLATGDLRRSPGFYSKYIKHSVQIPSPERNKDGFSDRVLELVKKHKIPYVYPITESSLIPLDERRGEFEAESAQLIAASSYTIRCGIDKKKALAIAEEQNVPSTRTIFPTSVQEAINSAEDWGYPVILKPQGRSNDSRVAGKFDFKVLYAHNADELKAILDTCADGIYPIMQEYAYGPHTQFNCFFENGEPHSFYQDDGVRMLPITGGIGTRLRSRAVEPELASRAIRIFRAMKWEGAGQAQFKGPGHDGDYRFIEVSVRLPASVGSAVASGIDVPWMQYQLFSGQKVDRFNTYKVGTNTRWFRGDTFTMAQYLLGDVPKSADKLPSKTAVFIGWLSDFFRPGLKHYVLSFSDPIPGLFELTTTITGLYSLLIRNIKLWIRG